MSAVGALKLRGLLFRAGADAVDIANALAEDYRDLRNAYETGMIHLDMGEDMAFLDANAPDIADLERDLLTRVAARALLLVAMVYDREREEANGG